ncbi:MAG: hypothetical protein EOP51_07460 [Sphingobacteriales bacterium]|nr:MAG: hypothetical protein EOP51_07460 [Sphingobacteriales bacterium]
MKLLSLSVLTMATLAFTSCKKEYTCKCTGGIGGGTYEQTIKAANKEMAKKDCAAKGTPPGTSEAMECVLK